MALKSDPKYGYYPWWPEDGDSWVHPDDVASAREMIPSDRIFRRDGVVGPYVVLHYGATRIRVRRTLWREVGHEGLDVDDWVEVLTRGMLNEPRTGQVREMTWNAHERAIEYLICDTGVLVPTRYRRDDLRRVEPTRP